MNKVSFGLILVFFSVFFSSCEQVIENPTLPFEERIVVYGILVPNQQIRIFVSKTVPPLSNEPVYLSLQDALVQLESDGETYTLYSEVASNPWDGRYFTTNLLQIQEGKQYNLTVQWKGKTARSTTFIPPKPILKSFWKSDTVFYEGTNQQDGRHRLNFSSPSMVNTMITGIAYFSGDTNYSVVETMDFSEEFNFLDYNKFEDSSVVSYETSLGPGEILYFRLLAVDQAFHIYMTTNDRRNNNDGIFGGGGGNPVWNVYGDGFGLFLGANEGYAIREK